MYKTYSNISYDKLVAKLVKEKYNGDEEFALINKGIEDKYNEEYIYYRNYVNDCKIRARAFIQERDKEIL